MDQNDFDLQYQEIQEKTGLFKKIINNFISSNSEVSKVFTLNPYCYSKYLKNNKKNNVLYILDSNILKKLEFNILHTSVQTEVFLKIIKF
jgi:hypothetical protein